MAVVPDLDPAEYLASGLVSGLEAGPVHHLFLEARKEALGRRVIPAVDTTAHAAYDPCFLEPFLIIVARILTGSVTVAENVQRMQRILRMQHILTVWNRASACDR